MSDVSSTSSLLSASVSTTATSTTANSTSTDSLDWDGLIEEAVNAKLAKADTIDLKISDNEAIIAAYEEMQSLLSDVLDATEVLRAASGSSGASSNAFLSRAAYLTENGDVDASASIAATVESGADTGTYELTVTQLAKSHKVAGTAQTAKTTELGYDGVIQLGTNAGTSSEIAISGDMTLDEIAEAINDVADTSGVQASVLKVSATDFRLILTSVETGEAITATSVSGDDVLTTLGILDSEGDFTSELQAAQLAIFTIDDIEITRSSNDVDDALAGVTLHLYQVTPADTSITIEVGTDLSTVKQDILTLVDAYNAFRDFAYANQQMPTTDADTDAVLFGDGTLRNIGVALYGALTTQIGEASLATLGITFGDTNNLELDEDVLDAALLNNADAVESLLTFQMSASSAKLLLLGRGDEVPEPFTLDIAVAADGSITSAAIDGDTSLFSVNGTRLIGKAGTVYEGYVLVYAGTSSKSVDVSFQTGIAELLYNLTSNVTDSTEGTLATLIDNLETVNEGLQDKSDDIRARAETYQTNLTNRYAQYQAAIAAAESTLDYLTTLLDTWNSSS